MPETHCSIKAFAAWPQERPKRILLLIASFDPHHPQDQVLGGKEEDNYENRNQYDRYPLFLTFRLVVGKAIPDGVATIQNTQEAKMLRMTGKPRTGGYLPE